MNLKKVKFVHNPKSGIIHSPFFIRKAINSALADAPFEYDFVETEYRGHAREISQQAAADGYDAVVAIGGDGTVNEVATELLHSHVSLGIIPMGSGNGLARAMEIPLMIRRAAGILIDGQVRVIDAGRIETHYFFINVGFGFEALIGKMFDDKSLRGPIPYFTIGFKEFLKYHPEVFIIKFNGKKVAVPALLINIANQRGWGNGAIIAPHAKPDDGLLDICIIHRAGFFYTLFHLPKIFTGNIEKV
ncbi:MAG: diacylglycerol kinase family lipid kinase, partial [Calditrichaeota bacterium]|nr:diacylglycerol kinase family lipid kinase [Calditrichota bacterium]